MALKFKSIYHELLFLRETSINRLFRLRILHHNPKNIIMITGKLEYIRMIRKLYFEEKICIKLLEALLIFEKELLN
ncbi:hypothetical protein SAMN05444484_10337 [Flavobacterium chilense]|uniref:Uncharacterized protein n=1 Tax=Flavobacterium chilense TaxID=946677 RepID=A0A1M7ERG7_9FLAO|nr:hypothetical protein SAMN05444484_10337 [Flavobacterium chilense]